MYRQLSENPTSDELRQYYEQIHKEAEEIMQQVWALRGWTVRWEWHNGICDDCQFLFDASGKCLGEKHAAIPQDAGMAGKIDSLKLSVSHTKKSVKISNKSADKPVEGKGRNLRLAYLDWLLNIEKQKAEEKTCAVP
ncbi:hypothetical protein pEaSNUABM30_00032 [Erwinia phage pEa_SNUABM_30]|uniref:Uncharacterized protein n=1 Tax=Erwinia phage pEa_SNUABM_30 TaxID=2869553 RepID=A0AAE8XPS5_9CAUD|nr:hypothetical protein MPK69_gp032 [Erwinia phage pEa_SNUABM_30]UAW53150.1 hypothetical protein pEaSNUABM30_00032 [Erwinia phage pEa_SNUABM_30]